jgi:hypothetical protein
MESGLVAINPLEVLVCGFNLECEKKPAWKKRGLNGAKNLFGLILVPLLGCDEKEPWPIYRANHLE